MTHSPEIQRSTGTTRTLHVEQLYKLEPLGLWDDTLIFTHYRVSDGFREITICNLIERMTESNCIGALSHEGVELAIAKIVLLDFPHLSPTDISVHKILEVEPDYNRFKHGLTIKD